MSLSTPSLYNIPAFDATNDNAVYFNVSGGDQVVANRLIVKLNSTLQTIYNDVAESYNFVHVIPANSLINGNYYVAYVKTYATGDDITDENAGSELSAGMPFYCYTTPVLTWANKPYASIVQTSTFDFRFSYYQEQDEKLYSYIINLYDQGQQLISSSGTKYVSSAILNIEYEVNGLLNNTNYYISITGSTVNNTQATTGLIPFTVSYYEPYSKQGFIATNDACNGWITLQNNVLVVDSTSYPSPPNYVYENTAVDVTDNGYYVKWENIGSTDDLYVRIWGYDFESNKAIFIYTQDEISYNLTLYRRDGYDYNSEVLQTYYELQVQTNDTHPYFIYSNYINQPLNTDQVFICIKRINNLYSLYIENLR